jgi:hypothetical protein
LHSLLGFEDSVEQGGWRFQMPPPGQRLAAPEPLFAKLDDSIVAEEAARLGKTK